MRRMVRSFSALTAEEQSLAGGKGGTLARLYQSGFPVPDGFVVLPSAFAGDELAAGAWEQIQEHLVRLRTAGNGTAAFAVRSSALSEDSAQASFAGEFETVLDVHTDEMIREAIHTVRRSRESERVQAYSQAKGMVPPVEGRLHEVAVVVQRLVRADISGILFTADPVTGSRANMAGNYIYGLGDELVSGEVEPYTFTLARPKGRYSGPPEVKRFARELYKLASRLERDLGCPQDIEWAIVHSTGSRGRLYVLQSRPITTLRECDPVTYDCNTSFTGDYMWALQEPFPDVLTPSSSFLWRQTYLGSTIGGIPSMGNIGGRLYMNMSLMYALLRKIGKKHEEIIHMIGMLVGSPPEDIEIPRTSISLRAFLGDTIPIAIKHLRRQRRLVRNLEAMVDSGPKHCRQVIGQIQQEAEPIALTALWHDQVHPLFTDFLLLQDAMNEQYHPPFASLEKALSALLEAPEVDLLLSSMSGGALQLASIGPLVDLAKVVGGEMSRKTYAELYGHRQANENELAQPRPSEDPHWLDREIAAFEKSPVDVEALLEKRAAEFDARWTNFAASHPKKAKSLQKKVDRYTTMVHKREAVRSELTRTVGVIRAWFLRVGELTGLADGIFFLTDEEVLALLAGDSQSVAHIPARRETLEKYKALPPYPGWIRGRFDPVQWAADPNRRSDLFDAQAPLPSVSDSAILRGHPGSAGRVEGLVRRIASPEEGDQLQPGEVLVAVTTNIGWTPLFPRAAAVVTDIGAPLAHAAIVARELGIPAVVGCGNATARLRTGDRVLVDGGRGSVEILGDG